MMNIRSQRDGKVHRFPMEIYRVLVDDKLMNADKVFFLTQFLVENNSDKLGLDDHLAETMALGLFEDIMSKQCYKLLLTEYQKKYGFREVDTQWVEDFKQIKQCEKEQAEVKQQQGFKE